MKITLIQPPKPFYGVEAEEHWQLSRPLSLFFLAASIEQFTKYEVQIIDLEHKKYRGLSLQEIFKWNNSEIFGITSTTFTRFEAIKIAKYLKQTFPNSLIIAGGVHFMNCAKETLEIETGIDLIVRGEGEKIIVNLLNAVSEGKNFENIKGITYRKNGQIIDAPEQSYFEHLDNLPSYYKFSWDEYPEYLFGYPVRIRAISILSSRGCPYNCIFCTKSGMKYRLRSTKNVVDEMEYFINKFELNAFNFLDLTFTANPRHVKAVCQEIIDRKLDIKWWCESRANIDLELLPLMKKAGCVSIVIGVETGSPEILSQISKGITIEQVMNITKKCFELGIHTSLYFMFSHKNETMKDVKKTLDLIRKLEKYILNCSFQPTMIFPGTKLEEIAKRESLLSTDFSWYHYYDSDLNKELGQMPNVPLYIDKLSPVELKKAFSEYWKIIGPKQAAKYAADLSFKELLAKVFNAIRYGNKSLKYLFSLRYYWSFIVAKIERRGNSY